MTPADPNRWTLGVCILIQGNSKQSSKGDTEWNCATLNHGIQGRSCSRDHTVLSAKEGTLVLTLLSNGKSLRGLEQSDMV